MKLIDKDALVAEIERRVSYLYPKNGQGMVITKILKEHYKDLKDFINTLEVKKVDLEKEFKQKYEQALERARVWKEKSGMPVDKQGILDDIFPELKESEDERIRKQLLNWFKDCSWDSIDDGNLKREDIIAWLEKQGKKIDAIENFDTEFEKQVSHLIASTINKEYEYTSDFVKWTANVLLNYAKHELEKKELKKIEPFKQKPAWSEEDEKMLKSVISSIRISRSSCEEDDDVRDLFDNEIDWLKSLKERVQPKQEWSEEDEEMTKCVLISLEFFENLGKDVTGHPHPNYFKVKHKIYPDSVRSWLKSIKERYIWKPSEEQMKQLGWVAEQNKDNMIGKELMTLYNNLKKLREE